MKVLIANIPNELKAQPNWVGWIKHPTRGKVPMNPLTGQPAKSNDPSTWLSFPVAYKFAKSRNYDGIGFMFRPPYVGIDLDDCVVDGELTPLATKILISLSSYTEYSPSGKGLHILCKGRLDKGFKKDTIEVYNFGRFFTMTGFKYGNVSEVKDDPKSLESLIHNEFGDISINKKPDGWVAEKLYQMKSGTIHNDSIAIIGRLHRDGYSASDIEAFMKPHIERIGGDPKALRDRIQSIQRYPTPETLLEAGNSEDFDAFMASGFDTINWIVQDIYANESIGFIAGLGETGKSWMLMDLAIECAKGGGYWLGKFPVKDAKVLYLDQERSAIETRRRFKKLLAAKNLQPVQLKENLKIMSNTSVRLNLDRSFEAFKKKLEELRPTLILVDSFITLNTVDDNNRSEVQKIFERLKELRHEFKCTFILLDHETKAILNSLNKDKEPNAHDVSGTTGKVAAAEAFLTVRKKGEGHSTVYHTKSTCGPQQLPFDVRIEDVDLNKTSVKAY